MEEARLHQAAHKECRLGHVPLARLEVWSLPGLFQESRAQPELGRGKTSLSTNTGASQWEGVHFSLQQRWLPKTGYKTEPSLRGRTQLSTKPLGFSRESSFQTLS